MKTKQVELEICKNLGNYETAKIRLVATITEKENVEEAAAKLNNMILKTFSNLYEKKTKPVTKPQPQPQEIKRDEAGKIIVEYSKDKDSLFQRIKRAVVNRKVEPEEIKKFYEMEKETFQLLFV